MAATCHSTNWDSLRRHVFESAVAGRLKPEEFQALELPEFVEWFGSAYAEERDLSARYEMAIESARSFLDGAPLATWYARHESGRQASVAELYDALQSIEAFGADPQQKKSRILVQQLVRSGWLTPADDRELHPAIEYHLLRLYLRTGRVTRVRGRGQLIPDRTLKMESIADMRRAVERAMRYTADAAELSILDVNDAEWQIGRSWCVRDEPRCAGPHLASKPVTRQLELLEHGACPYFVPCDGPSDLAIREMNEPRLASKHSFY